MRKALFIIYGADLIIDAHTHLGFGPEPKSRKSFEKNRDILLAEMQTAGVDHAVILSCFKSDEEDPDTDTVLELVKDVPNLSVVGSFDVIANRDEDLFRLQHLVGLGKIAAVKLYTGYQHFYPSDERCQPIYKMCQEYDIPVIFHSGDTYSGLIPRPKVKYAHPLHIDEVAADNPDLNIIIAHMGNPWLVDCAEVLYKNENVYADISGLVVGDSMNTPNGDLTRRRIHELIAYSSSDKLIYGTDWPLAPMEMYLKFFHSLYLSRAENENILWRTAARLFKIKTVKGAP